MSIYHLMVLSIWIIFADSEYKINCWTNLEFSGHSACNKKLQNHLWLIGEVFHLSESVGEVCDVTGQYRPQLLLEFVPEMLKKEALVNWDSFFMIVRRSRFTI